MIKHKRASAAAAVAAMTTAAAVSALTMAQASAPKTQILRFFDKPVALTVTHPGGTVTHPPYPQAKPGDILDVYSVDYAGNHLHHAARWSASGHLRCKFGGGAPDCESHTAIGGSLLIFHGNRLEAGTGIYQGASGRILSSKGVPGIPNASDVVAKIDMH